jgi:hypothetical protein
MLLKILYEEIYPERVRGRPTLRWLDVVRKDRRCTSMYTDAWRLLVQEGKAHNGL